MTQFKFRIHSCYFVYLFLAPNLPEPFLISTQRAHTCPFFPCWQNSRWDPQSWGSCSTSIATKIAIHVCAKIRFWAAHASLLPVRDRHLFVWECPFPSSCRWRKAGWRFVSDGLWLPIRVGPCHPVTQLGRWDPELWCWFADLAQDLEHGYR